jgi:predicted RNA-binding Zn ribbon-like protein
MAAVTVDGVRLPRAVAEHPALELCNTVAGWAEEVPFDFLVDYEVLARHAGHLELLARADVERLVDAATRQPRPAAQVLRRARELREATYRIVTGDGSDEHREVVRRAVAAAASGGVLERDDTSLARWAYDPQTAGLAVPLHLFAWQVQDLLTASRAPAIGRCPGRDCGWVFLNRGNRRWCSMATCGNREKARRHATRSRRGGGGVPAGR